MNFNYTSAEINNIVEKEPKKASELLDSIRKEQSAFRQRAQQAIATRQRQLPSNEYARKLVTCLDNYSTKYIKTGSFAPIVQLMMVVGIVGVGIEYKGHNIRHQIEHNSKEGGHH